MRNEDGSTHLFAVRPLECTPVSLPKTRDTSEKTHAFISSIGALHPIGWSVVVVVVVVVRREWLVLLAKVEPLNLGRPLLKLVCNCATNITAGHYTSIWKPLAAPGWSSGKTRASQSMETKKKKIKSE
ncbi:hypothetical protein AFLA_002939 [Aspergillus flavus NRRL3357]|nr:hypothetical protein AFLA_002939 [Aspergillus flavus NRRL3357]